MFTKKEVAWIIISIIIFEFILFFPNYNQPTLRFLLVPILILATNILVKKLSSKYYSIRIEHKIFEFQRYGWVRRAKLKKPFPIGLILPIIASIISFGFLKPLTFLQFESHNIQELRILKQRGSYRKSEINESDPAIPAALSYYALIILAMIGSIFNYPELSSYCIFYGFWNLIPYGNLDGNKIFFGSFANWTILAIVYIFSLIIVLA